MSDDEKEVEKEEEPKEGGLSDGVLDAFEEAAPVDPLLVDEDGEEILSSEEEEEEDGIDSGDYRVPNEW